MRSLLLLSVFAACIFGIKGQCSVTVKKDLPSPQPLVLKPGKGSGFRYPNNKSGTLNFARGENVRLVCVGSGNKFSNLAGTQTDVLATCVSGKTFTVSGVSVAFQNLRCKSLPTSIQRRSGKTCHRSNTDVEIGFNLGGNEWITLINACYNANRVETIYTKFKLAKEIGGFQSGFPRPDWTQGEFWAGYNQATQYKRSTQISTVGTVLGSSNLGTKYIHATNDYFFARGHLTAKADFVYGVQHNPTFYIVNQMPQWQTFNGANWNNLENDVRSFASNTWQDLTVYTGVHGIVQLPNSKGVLTDLYFYANNSGKRAIPIPKFFWKIIYNEATQLGTAFIGVNNPYLDKVTSDYYLCSDISSRISWLTWSAKSVSKGVSYACTVDSLRKVVSNIPAFNVRGILA